MKKLKVNKNEIIEGGFKGQIKVSVNCNVCKRQKVEFVIWDDFFGEGTCNCGNIITGVIRVYSKK